jgi:hypothetical protein
MARDIRSMDQDELNNLYHMLEISELAKVLPDGEGNFNVEMCLNLSAQQLRMLMNVIL